MTAETLPVHHLSELSEAVAQQFGLHFPPERWPDLERAVRKSSARADEPAGDFTESLLRRPWDESRIESLVEFLTIGETHFFRDGKLFRALEEELLSELVLARRVAGRRLRLWSAGCATGEEPYSLAIMLNKLLFDLPSWTITILATDVNGRFLEKAGEGVYTPWSFRSVPEGIKEKYFIERGDASEIIPTIKRMVTFRRLNLVKDSFPLPSNDTADMDIIFCRNVLMYLTPDHQRRVVDKLCVSLVDGGWLIVSPAEAVTLLHQDLDTVNFNGAVLYRKRARKTDPSNRERPLQFPIFPLPPPFDTDTGAVPYAPFKEPAAADTPPKPEIPVPAKSPEPVAAPTTETATEDDLFERARTLYDEGRYSETIDTLMSRLSDAGSSENVFEATAPLAVRAFANQGRLDEALEWAGKLLERDKLIPSHHFLHATILEEMGFVEDAVAAMGRALFLDPNLVSAHFAMGNLARRRGKNKDARRHYRIALTILTDYNDDDEVPESDGMTAAKLTEVISSILRKENGA